MKKYADYQHASISMSTDKLFSTTLEKLFSENDICSIVESGTYIGLGSTATLANAILKSGKPAPNFITIEVDRKLYKKAVKNLRTFKFVTPKWGLSISSAEAKAFIENDEAILNHEKYPDIFIDYTDNPVKIYLEEIDGLLSKRVTKESLWKKLMGIMQTRKKLVFEENIFDQLIPAIRNTNPLFLLDSAGGVGYLEFLTVNKLMKEQSYFLILDDIHHLKHFRSFRDISAVDSNYTIIEKSLENGWVIAKYNNPND